MDFLKVLPMAFVMVAGPQIVSAFFFATSPSWKKISGRCITTSSNIGQRGASKRLGPSGAHAAGRSNLTLREAKSDRLLH